MFYGSVTKLPNSNTRFTTISFSTVMWVWFTLNSEGRACAPRAGGEGPKSWSLVWRSLVDFLHSSSTGSWLTESRFLKHESRDNNYCSQKGLLRIRNDCDGAWHTQGINSLLSLPLHKSESWLFLKVVFIHHISSGGIVNTLYVHVYHICIF